MPATSLDGFNGARVLITGGVGLIGSVLGRRLVELGADIVLLDAMDPNDLRDCVEQAIRGLIEPVAWKRCEIVNRAEQESLRTVLDSWKGVS